MSFGGGGGGGGQIATAADVALSNPANGQVLSYNTTLSKWQNANGVTAVAVKAVCVYSGSSYPTRPSGYGSVEFIGPVDPGAAAQTNDTWVNTA
jgi:hypothetical protein